MGRSQRTDPGDPVTQIYPFYKLLRDVMERATLPHLINLDDMRMDQAGRRPGLSKKPLNITLLFCQIGIENFECDLPFKRHLFGQIDLGHCPPP